jgi:fructose-bisphosphate aldolase, class I
VVLSAQQRVQDQGRGRQDDDYHVAADLTGQANHLGVTIQADIIKQKLPENNGGFEALNMGGKSYGKFDKRMYTRTLQRPSD